MFSPKSMSNLGCLMVPACAAGFALLNLPKGKSLDRSKPETNSYAQALATHCVGFLLYPSSAELHALCEIK